jgi:UDP-N-acetylmuramyl pentapeptide phosphotransferase/UDP-N-acetylglucosamine-1-phosphate transferase
MAVTSIAGRSRPRRWRAVLAWVLWALALLGIAAIVWFDQLLRQAGRVDLVQLNASAVPFLLALVSAPTVGAVLATRRPRHPVGWLLLSLGVSIGLSGFLDGYAPMACWHGPGRSRRPAGPPSTARR